MGASKVPLGDLSASEEDNSARAKAFLFSNSIIPFPFVRSPTLRGGGGVGGLREDKNSRRPEIPLPFFSCACGEDDGGRGKEEKWCPPRCSKKGFGCDGGTESLVSIDERFFGMHPLDPS